MRLKTPVVILTFLLIATGFLSQTAFAELNKDNQLPQKSIHISDVCPNPVLERGLFYVEVRDNHGDPVKDATVTVQGYDVALTNSNGKAWFIAPSVSEDTTYTIVAYKDGYVFVGGSWTITVRNRYLQLLSVPTQMNEQTTDTVWVVDQDGNGVWGAKVKFGCNTDYTNIFGQAVAEAPDVTGNKYVTITASYSGYDSDSDQVYVIDLDIIPATIHCYVYDTSQNPIEGATVTIEKITYGGSIGDTSSKETDESGYCCFIVYPDTTIGYTKYRFTAEADGYDEDWEDEIAHPGGTYTVVLELPIDDNTNK
jgi:hypothetical protein